MHLVHAIQLTAHSPVDLVQVDKHELVFECGIHHRDLRIVDPHIHTASPSAIFIREKAIVVNLESLRYCRSPSKCSKSWRCMQLSSDPICKGEEALSQVRSLLICGIAGASS